ncbi:MAG: molybdopterin-dependent oxidoreductase [Halieaceae bacterium]|jgi:anaerobic selenocysteine-containing dehydrogenase|nr:molybdopterin-dependent oxidoreductase [Halieaceae bacterium]
MDKARSVCPLDCADTCSLEVSVEEQRVAAVRGSNANPFTRGKLCAKVVNAFPDQVHGPQRIATPLLRRSTVAGHDFQPIGWDEALDLVHDRFSEVIERWGSEAIAPLSYGGPMGLLAGGSMDKRFFHRLGATIVDSSSLCAGTSSAAWESVFGDAGGIDFEELAHSRLIIVWGNNITTCNLHATRIIRDAQKSGAKLVVVDPKRTRIARDADLHIPLLPGTDVVLAYAVARCLEGGGIDRAFVEREVHGADAFLAQASSYDLERAARLCEIDGGLIERFADLLREARPAAMCIGVAPERNRNGSAGIRGALSLMALTGNIGPIGAGICDTSRFFPTDGNALTRRDLAADGLRTINVMDIPRYAMEPGTETPLRALFVYNHNPVAVHPEQARMRAALLSDDVFVVGHDVSMTDSMACCDLVLPAPTHFEYGDVYKAYGHRYLQRSQAVIPPQGEALSNMELFRRLAARFDFDEPCFSDSDEALVRQALPTLSVDVIERAKHCAVDMQEYAEPAMLRGTRVNTPSGKIELYSEAMEAHCCQGLPRFQELGGRRPFLVVSPASEKRVNSTFGGKASQQDDIACEIHPQDAAAHAIGDGQRVILSNDAGEIELAARITDAVRRGTLYVPKGAWLSSACGDGTINALIPGHKEAAIGGACYYDCSVDLRPAASS